MEKLLATFFKKYLQKTYMENSRIKINVIYNDYVDNNQTLFLKFYCRCSASLTAICLFFLTASFAH